MAFAPSSTLQIESFGYPSANDGELISQAKGRKILFRLEKEGDGTLKFTEEYDVDVRPP
jgi:hypothetical protein